MGSGPSVSLECWKRGPTPYKVRCLISNSVYAKRRKWPSQCQLRSSHRLAILFHSAGEPTHLPLSHPFYSHRTNLPRTFANDKKWHPCTEAESTMTLCCKLRSISTINYKYPMNISIAIKTNTKHFNKSNPPKNKYLWILLLTAYCSCCTLNSVCSFVMKLSS